MPPFWRPVDAKELLSEEWTDPLYIGRERSGWRCLGPDEGRATAFFEELTRTGKCDGGGSCPEKGECQILIETDYVLWLNEGVTGAKAEFTLPFNIQDNFKTVKYYAVSTDDRLAVKSKWPQTKTKPSQEGIIYTLPIAFKILIKNHNPIQNIP